MSNTKPADFVIGAGPAGLTAADFLTTENRKVIVCERNDLVGGISRTENQDGYRFDLGGHRFFTKIPQVQDYWESVLKDSFIVRDRLSRIYFRNKFIDYPLKPSNALPALGLTETIKVLASYAWWRLNPYREVNTFAQWVSNRFGRRLFEIFFKTYTEKVWGISTDELSADWAAQRIKDLSLIKAVINSFKPGHNKITSLIEQFHYPRFGPGMMWDAVAEKVGRQGGTVLRNAEVTQLRHNGTKVKEVAYRIDHNEELTTVENVISSIPLPNLINSLDPAPPKSILEASDRLSFRDFLTVVLIVDHPDLFPDNWIYIHDPEVSVGRIQNFKNWSPDMVPNETHTSLGLEYFCNQNDDLWDLPDEALIELATRELEQIGLNKSGSKVLKGFVVRVPNAYPVYDKNYHEAVKTVREYLAGFENLQTIGRAGLHRYDNQDHAMMTGIYAAQNILDAGDRDVWSINTELSYHEEGPQQEDGALNRGRNPNLVSKVSPGQ
ncbi:MAG: NAD(P)/FAD-dependent oxidoreductase [Pseudomonadota bacterium]